MKDETNKHAESNATTESHGMQPTATVPNGFGKFPAAAGAGHGSVSSTEADEISLTCFGCYIRNTIQHTLEVSQEIRELVSTNGKKEDIEEGFDLVEFALDGLLKELATKDPGKGLPSHLVPVRGVPYIVTPKK